MSLGDHWKLLSWSTNYIDPMQCRLWKAISASLCDLMCKALKHREVNNWVCSESQINPLLTMKPIINLDDGKKKKRKNVGDHS